MVNIKIILAIIGLVAGALIGVVAFALMVANRRAVYQIVAVRHPWIRLVPIVWIVACGRRSGVPRVRDGGLSGRANR